MQTFFVIDFPQVEQATTLVDPAFILHHAEFVDEWSAAMGKHLLAHVQVLEEVEDELGRAQLSDAYSEIWAPWIARP